jgi:hypothetical protein
VTKGVFSVTSIKNTFRLLNRRNKKGDIAMKSLIFIVYVLFITGCSHQYTKSLDDRMDECKKGYLLALRSGSRDLTESVIFQIILKKMSGYLEDSEQIEEELSRLVLAGKDESTRKKAELALRFLNNTSNVNTANIRSIYYEENRLFYLLEEYFDPNVPDWTQVK